MDRYAVVGNPIAHSKSPDIHQWFAEQTGESLTYEKILVELAAFDEDACSFFALGGKGLNVTVPFKEQAFRFANHLTAAGELDKPVDIGELLDTIAFSAIAATVIGIETFGQYVVFVLVGWVWKTAVELLLAPVTMWTIARIKTSEPHYGSVVNA